LLGIKTTQKNRADEKLTPCKRTAKSGTKRKPDAGHKLPDRAKTQQNRPKTVFPAENVTSFEVGTAIAFSSP